MEAFKGLSPFIMVLIGTGFTFLLTVVGASMVFFVKKEVKATTQNTFLGFAAGVMIAASVWSLLIPAIDMADKQGIPGWLPAGGGFVLGGLFLFLLDKLLPHLHIGKEKPEGMSSSFNRTTLLVLAVTMHNIPEGMAVGLAFGLAGQTGSGVGLAAAFALAIGIGIQNFPEGAAISLPLKKEGFSSKKAFGLGALSGFVEPVSGVIGFLLVNSLVSIMPWMLSFAAGSMIYVVAEELIPEANSDEHSHAGTLGVMAGFLIMMILDVALG